MGHSELQADVRDAAALPVRRPSRYLALDVWRGLACLMIVILHAAHTAHDARDATSAAGAQILSLVLRMSAGVPMFFVISGYCIAATADAARQKPASAQQFFRRRFRRIYPPYWAVGLLCLALATILTSIGQGDLVSDAYSFIPHPRDLSPSQWLGNLTLTETWRPHLFGDAELKVIGPSWTLCYEEQFYAVCGLLLVFAPRRFFLGTVVVTLLTLVIAPLGGESVRGFFFDGRWLMFAEGIAVYHLLNSDRSRRQSLAIFTLVLMLVAVVRYGIVDAQADFARNLSHEMLTSTTFALVLLALHRWDRQIAEARVLRPLALCGQMCYSLYLVHWPITAVLTTWAQRSGVTGVWATLLLVAPTGIVLSLGASWLFHRVVETRFLNTRPTRSTGYEADQHSGTATITGTPIHITAG